MALGKQSSEQAGRGFWHNALLGSRVTWDRGTSPGRRAIWQPTQRAGGGRCDDGARVGGGWRRFHGSRISSCHPSRPDWGKKRAERFFNTLPVALETLSPASQLAGDAHVNGVTTEPQETTSSWEGPGPGAAGKGWPWSSELCQQDRIRLCAPQPWGITS